MPFIKENEVLSKETKQLKICLSQIEKKHDQLMKVHTINMWVWLIKLLFGLV